MEDEPICLDDRFSTTRLLFRGKAASDDSPHFDSEGMSSLPTTREKKAEGGLRTKGFSKQDCANKPLVSVITVVFNGTQVLENTVKSVISQTYDNIEYIIIDGGSTDGTLETISKFGEEIDYWVSEPDRGIYDAMNRGLAEARGEWINFMNAGDAFCSNESISATVKEFSDAMVYYSDAIFYLEHRGHCYYRQIQCDVSKHLFVHQSCIYRKQLHSIYGKYIVAKLVTAADYLFFRCIPPEQWHKTKTVISKYYVGRNTSSGRRHSEQVYGIDLLFGSRTLGKTFANHWFGRMQGMFRRLERCLLTRNLYLLHVDKYSKADWEKFWQNS